MNKVTISKTTIDQFLNKKKWLYIDKGTSNDLAVEHRAVNLKETYNYSNNQAELYEHAAKGGNIGWILSPFDFVVKVDLKIGGATAIGEIIVQTQSSLVCNAKTQDALYFYFENTDSEKQEFLIPEGFLLRKNLAGKKSLQIIESGMLAIPGAIIDGLEMTWRNPAKPSFFCNEINPKLLTKFIELDKKEVNQEFIQARKSKLTSYASAQDIYDSMHALSAADKIATVNQLNKLIGNNVQQEKRKLTAEQIEELLSFLSPDTHLQDWLQIGSSVKCWDEHEGRDIFERWSMQSSKYNKHDFNCHWKCFKPWKSSLGVLVNKAKAAGWQR